jgi:Right handed beta helix region
MSLNRGSTPRLRRMVHIASVVGMAILISSATPVTARMPQEARCRGVRVAPGDNLQALIDRHQRRTTFCFVRGVYHFSETIWTANKFPRLDLRAGAVIDGGDGAFVGISGLGAPDRTRGTIILGGTFENFGNVNSLSVSPIDVMSNWIIKGTELRRNFNTGLSISGDDARVSSVYVHHNGRYGITVSPSCADCQSPSGVLIQNSEIAFNNTRHLSTIDDAGGTKFCCGTIGMIVRGNEVHDNFGSGLWWDTGSQDARVYNNMIHDNRNWGIFWEASHGGAKIHDNTLINNGVGDGTLNWGANVQLLVSNSNGSIGGGIEIYDNLISGTAIAIGLLNHTEGGSGTTQVYAHHNLMTLRANSALVGGDVFFGDPGLFSPEANNRFEHNAYRVRDRGGSYWKWNGETLTWQEWQAVGHDEDGTLRLIA